MSYDVSKVLIEGDDEACSHKVKLAGMLKSLAENIEKNLFDLGEKMEFDSDRNYLHSFYIMITDFG